MPLQHIEPTERDDQTRIRPHGTGPDEATTADAPDDGAPGDDPAPTGAATDRTDLRLIPPALEHGSQLWRLARDAGLDINSPYAYALWCRDFSTASVVALDADGVARGFVTGYVRSESPDTYFLWQVAVDAAVRGQGLARRMLDHIGDRIAGQGITWLEATVTPDNAASRALFASFARDRGAELVWTPMFDHTHFPEDADHDPEDLVRIGPLS